MSFLLMRITEGNEFGAIKIDFARISLGKMSV